MLVTNIDAPTGGVQKNSKLLLNEFKSRNIKCFVCARNYHNLPRYESVNGTSYHRSPVLSKSLALNGVLYLIDTFFWLIKNRKKYDVIHCQQMFGPTMVAAVAGYIVNKPILTRVTSVGDLGEVKAVQQMPLSGLRLKLLRGVSKWIALTQEMKNELETLNIPPEKIKIIHNSTEIPAEAAFSFETKSKYRKKLDLDFEKIAVFTGRLSSEKGLDILIKAWKKVTEKHPDAHLLLLGEGGNFRNVEKELRDLTEKLELSTNVHFLGFVPNPKDYILASDIFILPSSTEGMSNSLVEAFACGAAIAASAIGSNREICDNEINSLLVEFGNVEKWTEAILRILDAPDFALKLAQNARRKAEADLSVETMVNKYLDAYREIIKKSDES
jgi:glycosyltransferase involved in cell wall biosynthesis